LHPNLQSSAGNTGSRLFGGISREVVTWIGKSTISFYRLAST
jgi:hypothetical protein